MYVTSQNKTDEDEAHTSSNQRIDHFAVFSTIMMPKRLYQSISLIYQSYPRRRYLLRDRWNAKASIELKPPIFVSDVTSTCKSNYLTHQWFCSTGSSSIRDEATVSSPIRPNAFRLFSLPLSFNVDEELLRTKYHNHMKVLHPDKQTNESDGGSPEDPTVVAAITNAYNVLKRPHLRAMLLLKIMKQAPNDPESHDDDDDHGTHLQDPSTDFLLEVMDLQESIHELDSDEELKPYFDENMQRITDTCEQLQKAFEASNIEEFQYLTMKLKYWTRIDETLRNKMTSLE